MQSLAGGDEAAAGDYFEKGAGQADVHGFYMNKTADKWQ
jgi:hypothetical protein